MSMYPAIARFAAHGATLRETMKLPVARLCFWLCVAVSVLAALGIAAAPFHILLNDFYKLPSTLAGLAATIVLQMAILMRLDGDTSWQAKGIAAFCQRLGDICLLGMAAAVFFCCAHLLQALAACVGFPWQDDLFSAIDRGAGLQWLPFVSALNAYPAAVTLLILSYQSIAVTLPVLLLALVVRGDRAGMWRLTALMMLGGFMTIVVSCFVPAIGGYTYYGADTQSAGEFVRQWPLSGTYFVPGLLRIYGGHIDRLDLAAISGIVQFPSFHGIIALVLMYEARGIALLFWPYVVINLVMLVSTVPVGGHHFVDCVGSLAVFAASVAIVDACEGKPSLAARVKQAFARKGFARPAALAGTASV